MKLKTKLITVILGCVTTVFVVMLILVSTLNKREII